MVCNSLINSDNCIALLLHLSFPPFIVFFSGVVMYYYLHFAFGETDAWRNCLVKLPVCMLAQL